LYKHISSIAWDTNKEESDERWGNNGYGEQMMVWCSVGDEEVERILNMLNRDKRVYINANWFLEVKIKMSDTKGVINGRKDIPSSRTD
jgi:hypothetical protein